MDLVKQEYQIDYSKQEVIQALKKTVAIGATDEEFWMFTEFCKSSGLNPLKKEGVKAGYPDVLIDIPNKHYAGLRIEFKRPKGKQSEHQKDWQERLTRAGYLYVVCYSVDEAIKVLTDYLKLAKWETKWKGVS